MPESKNKKRPSTRYRPFEEAREYARSLGLKTQDDWVAFIRGEIHDLPQKPSDIPNCPDFVYKGHGWAGFRNWLGLSHGRSLPFKEAREYARSLGLKSQREWLEFARGKCPDIGEKPKDIPILPWNAYRRCGWESWADWLGLPENRWRPFEEARDYVRLLNLESRIEWVKFARGQRPDLGQKPFDIPATPLAIYKRCGWCGYRDWLGLPVKKHWRTYADAREFARNLGLQSIEEWRLYCKGESRNRIGVKPENIPAAPDMAFKNKGWLGWGDFLGNGVVEFAGKTYEPFVYARKYVHSLNLKSQTEWFALCDGNDLKVKDINIPVFPNTVYNGRGWTSWKDWLGVTGASPNWSYEKARDFARSLNLKGNKDWRKYCRGELINKPPMPEGITATPEVKYKRNGWTSWGDFLGTGKIALSKRKFRPFKNARIFARMLNLKNNMEWRLYCKGELPEKGIRPDDIPSNANRVYRRCGWINWGDFLGTNNIANYNKKYRSFKEAQKFAKSLNLKNNMEWRKYCKNGLKGKPKKPDDIPANPDGTYRNKGWVSWGSFLGTGAVAIARRIHKPFTEARNFARSLNLKSSTEWKKYTTGRLRQKKPLLPSDIPGAPDHIYKNKGWISWGDWLGTGRIANAQKTFRSFKDARSFVRTLNLKDIKEWRKYSRGELTDIGKKPTDIPVCPNESYLNKGWTNWGDFLGTGRIASRDICFRPFEEARSFVRSLKLASSKEWSKYSAGRLPEKGQRPPDIPSVPFSTYKDKWKGWPDFLGYDT